MSNIILPALIMMIIGIFVFISTVIFNAPINKVFQKRLNLMILGIVGLIFFIAGKYVWYIIAAINKEAPITLIDISINHEFWDNLRITNLALISFPDLLVLLISLAFVFDKTKNVAKVMAPYGLFFGLVYLLCSTFIYTDTSYVASFNLSWVNFIFEGDGITRMPSITFIFLTFISLVSIITCREYSRWSMFSSIVFGGLIYTYSCVFQLFYDVGADGVTALSFAGLAQDISTTNGSLFANYFFAFAKALNIAGDTDKAYIGTLVLVGMLLLLLILVFLLKNLLTRDVRRMNFIYHPWYYKSRLFHDFGAYVDGFINNLIYKVFKVPYLFGILPQDVKEIKKYVDFIKLTKSNDEVDKQKLQAIINEYENNKTHHIQDEQHSNKKRYKLNKKKFEQSLVSGEFFEFDKKPNAKKTTSVLDSEGEKQSLFNLEKSNDVEVENNVMVQQWTDENGTMWALNNKGQYYYWSNNRWINYQ